jgi:hypothetical protein
MFRCWSCGTEHEYPAASAAPNREIEAAYAQGYLAGYSDAEKHYTNKCTLCGVGGTPASLCIECKKDHPYWRGE